MGRNRIFGRRCHLCGAPTDEDHRSGGAWLNQVRALYVQGRNLDSARVSGIGLRMWPTIPGTQQLVHVPESLEDSFTDPESVRMLTILDTVPDYLHQEHNETGPLWGFIIHNSCWRILQGACVSQNIDAKHLLCLFISHFKGPGLLSWSPSRHHVIEEWHDEQTEWYSRLRYNTLNNDNSWTMDPINQPWVNLIVPEFISRRRSQIDSTRSTKAIKHYRRYKDCFCKLPFDICELILCILSSKDVLNLLIASKSLSTIHLSQTFWSSRFRKGHEYDTFLDAYQYKIDRNCFIDYKALYVRLKHKKVIDSKAVWCSKNRARILKLIDPLVYLIKESCDLVLRGDYLPTIWEPNPEGYEDTSFNEKINISSLVSNGVSIEFRCRRLFRRRVKIKLDDINFAYLVLLPMGRYRYVTGLQFQDQYGSTMDLGYRGPKSQFEHIRQVDSGGGIQEKENLIDQTETRDGQIGTQKILWGLAPLSSDLRHNFIEFSNISQVQLSLLLPHSKAIKDVEIIADFDGFRMICLQVSSQKRCKP